MGNFSKTRLQHIGYLKAKFLVKHNLLLCTDPFDCKGSIISVYQTYFKTLTKYGYKMIKEMNEFYLHEKVLNKKKNRILLGYYSYIAF